MSSRSIGRACDEKLDSGPCCDRGLWPGRATGRAASVPMASHRRDGEVETPRRPVWTGGSNGRFPSTSGAEARRFAAQPPIVGVEVNVYVRAKIGFCNCTTGVADDEELDRVADPRLGPATPRPRLPVAPISVAWMKGRSRAYKAKPSVRKARRLRLPSMIVGDAAASQQPSSHTPSSSAAWQPSVVALS